MGLELTTIVVMGTDCTGSCKSNYRTIMATTSSHLDLNLGDYMYVISVNKDVVIWTGLYKPHFKSQLNLKCKLISLNFECQ